MGLQKFYYENLKRILCYEPIDYSSLALEDHEELYKMALAHDIHLFVYESFKNSYISKINFELLNKWKSKYIRKTLNQQQTVNNIKGIFNAFKESDLQVMILKGIAYARYYKNPFARRMTDLDIYVRHNDIDKIDKILEGFWYYKVDNKGLPSHHIIYKNAHNITIELHTKLVDENKFPELALLSEDIFENTYMTSFNGIDFLSPKAEYELLFCLAHMYKHYYDVGFGFKQICDVFQIINHNSIDWKFVYDKMETYKIKSFSMALFKIIKDYFSIDFPQIYNNEFIGLNHEIMSVFLDDIYASGAFGLHDKAKYLSNHIADHKFENEQGASKLITYKNYLFPSRDYMIGYQEFQYLRNNKFLLPIAWIKRIRKHLKKGHLKKEYINQDLIHKRILLKNWMTDA